MFNIKRNIELERITVLDLYKLHKAAELDTSPYYQRFSDIWNDEKKRLLIDSIINGYDIPKFYFHYITSNDNSLNITSKRYAIIDGKQRINALIEFLNGDLKLDETVKWLESPETNFNKITYDDIKSKNSLSSIRTRIDNFQLDVIHVITDEFDRIEEMFLRLNEGVPVNNAEKRNSIGGYLIEGINTLVKSSDFFNSKVRFGNKRMEYQDLVSKLCLIDSSTSIESFTKRNLDYLVKSYKPKSNTTETEKRRLKSQATELLTSVNNGLSRLIQIFDDKDEMLRYKGIIPLYYLFLKHFNVTNSRRFKSFLVNFELARAMNRKITKKQTSNTTLLQFDRLNQQGAHQAKSLETRLKIMSFYFSNNDFSAEMPFDEIGIDKEEESV